MEDCPKGTVTDEITQFISKKGDLTRNCRDITIGEQVYEYLSKYELKIREPHYRNKGYQEVKQNGRFVQKFLSVFEKKGRLLTKHQVFFDVTISKTEEDNWVAVIYQNFSSSLRTINSLAFAFGKDIEIRDFTDQFPNGCGWKDWVNTNEIRSEGYGDW